jgi:hypothetical protein
MQNSNNETSRRVFLRDGSLFLLTTATGLTTKALAAVGQDEKPALTAALITDVHYADANARGTRYYRESLDKMRETVKTLGEKRPTIAVELGDLVDTAPGAGVAGEIGFLKTINAEFIKISPQQHYVLGNHCVGTLSKPQFLDTIERKKSYYSFDQNGFHFIILDACFRKDGVAYDSGNYTWTDTEIPPEQQEWLKADLAAAKGKALVFVHQRLDMPPGNYTIHSAAAVRKILEESGKTLAVFMGHSHTNEHRLINGISYVTLGAMVEGTGPENSGYSLLNVFPNGVLRLDGYRHHAENPFAKKPAAIKG